MKMKTTMEEKDNNARAAEMLTNGFDYTEELRVEGYEMALNLNANRDAARQKERERLAKKYGEKHDRVKREDTALAASPRYAKSVRTQQVRAVNTPPKIPQGAWQVHGLVTDAKGKPKGDITVSLFNKEGKWERPLGHSCTDPNGVYTIHVEDEKTILQYKDVPLNLVVSDERMRILYKDPQPIYVVPNRSMVRRLVVDEEKCLPPESDKEMASAGPPPAVEQPKEKGYMVWGYVKNSRGIPMHGVTVKATALTADGECDLGKRAVTDEKGRYKIIYTAADFGAEDGVDTRADIIHTVYDASGKQIYQSEGTLDSPQIARVDVVVRRKWFL
jgi:5-hydroxyisourate hydrolase-like protein (transthyretin family)